MAGFLGGGGAAGSDTAAANESVEAYETGIGAEGLTVVLEIVGILEYYGVLPSPLHLIESAFQGRPREQATSQSIFWLLNQRNPAARLWGIALTRLLTDSDIVISSSDAGDQQLLGEARASFVKSLVAQGATAANAQTIANIALSPAAQNGTAVSDFLQQTGPSNFGVLGDADWLRTYAKGLQLYPIVSSPSGQQPKNSPEKYLYQHAPLNSLLNAWYGPPGPLSYQPTAPSDPTVNPCNPGYVYNYLTNTCLIAFQQTGPFGQGCATGYSLDSTGLICELNPQPQPPPATTGPGSTPGGGSNGGGNGGQTGGSTIPPPPPAQSGGDELSDCCNSTTQYLYYVAVAVQNLAAAQPGGGSSTAAAQCCANIVTAIGALGTTISQLPNMIASLLGSGGAPAVDLSGITTALATINATLETGNAQAFGGAAEISSALANIATAISKGEAPDLTAITQALQTIATEGDVSDAAFAYLEAQGYITGGDVQFYVGMPWATAFFVMIRKFAHDVVKGFIGEVTGYDIDTGLWNYTGIPRMESTIQTIAGAWLKTQDSIIQPLLDPIVTSITQFLQPSGATSYTKIGVDPGKAPAAAVGTALSMTIGMTLFSYLGIDIGEGATRIAELVAAGVGYEQLRDVVIGPVIKHGIAKQSDFTARALFRQEGPGYGELVRLAARGYISTDRPPQLAAALGIPAEFEPVLQAAAYTSMPERLLIQLLESPLFSSADLTRVLTEHGLNPRDQALLQTIMPYLATRPQRSALIATYERMYELGLASATDLSNGLESAESNTDFDSLISTNANLKKAIAMTLDLEKSYTEMAKAGLMVDTLYQSNLESIGFQADMAATLTAVIDNHLATVAFRQAAAAERQLVRATTAAERKAALANFNAGNLDAAGYAAALLLTGMTSIQAAAWVDLATVRKAGSTRWIYGLQLTPQAATLLKERVIALTDQRKTGLLSDANYIAALQALGLSDNWINALRATADASTAATASTFVPVRTS